MAAKRQAASLLRRLLKEGVEGASSGLGPSTSYSSAGSQRTLLWRGLRTARVANGANASGGNVCRHAQQAMMRRETADFMRQWRRGFKAVALGSGVGLTQQSQSLLTALLPPALLWLWMMLPAGYRTLAFKLWRLDPQGEHAKQGDGCGGDGGADGPGSSSALGPWIQIWGWIQRQLRLPRALAAAVLEELLLVARAAYLCALFTPAVLSVPLLAAVGGGEAAREQWLRLVTWTLEHAGPAFIKWGQWASTRPDLFPEDLCTRLELLQTSAPGHSPAVSLQAVERAFATPISTLFETFEEQPLASGSIAQVHVATLSAQGAELIGGGMEAGMRVAIKVRHPGVTQLMHRDFILMQRAAALASRLPALRELRLEESIRQFGGPLHEQLDLSVEAEHLARFNANFRAWGNVRFPVPLYPLVGPDVLVESFEEGSLISRYVRTPHRHNAALAQTGVNVFLTMMLQHNFIHADLHPGNIIVHEAAPPSPLAVAAAAWMPARCRSWFLDRAPQIVLLDTGMIVTLSADDRSALLGFFRALTQQDGRELASQIVNMSVDGACKDPEAFAVELEGLFGGMDREHLRLESQAVIRDLIDRMRKHQVTLRSSVSTVVVTSLVLEGWSSKLDPEVRILDTMRDMLATRWADRIGRSVDRLMAGGQLAEA